MPTDRTQLKTYVDEKTGKKIKNIADKNYRTISKQLEYLIQKEIEKYESEKGEIKIDWNYPEFYKSTTPQNHK